MTAVPPGSQGRVIRQNRALLAARSRYAEEQLNEALVRGARQYVILGAGLDTFAYRNPNTNLRVFVPTDFEERTLASALEAAGFRAGEVSFFSWLGVSPYPTVQATLEALAFIGSLPAGSGLVLDYASRRSLLDAEGFAAETALDSLASRFADLDEPLELFVDPGALDKLLRSAGFREVEDLGPAEIDQRYFGDRTDGLRMPAGAAHLVGARV
jgi:O-methyltransferase involved in polyketide biosynthesis